MGTGPRGSSQRTWQNEEESRPKKRRQIAQLQAELLKFRGSEK